MAEKLKELSLFLENWLTSSSKRKLLLSFLTGVVFIGLGVFLIKGKTFFGETKVEVLEDTSETQKSEIIVEVSGAVEKPAVYKLISGSRVEDALILAGGVSLEADRTWMDKFLNRAARLTDGQKIYIPKQSDVLSAKDSGGIKPGQGDFGTQTEGLININTAALKELDSLPGIGPVYGQNIIDHRPYSNVEELLSKGVLKKSVYEKIKNSITVY